MEEKCWYIAYTKTCRERKAAEVLQKMGVEHYLPIRKEVHKWSDRKKVVERVVIPHMIFIRCLPSQRIPILPQNHHLSCYMTDKSTCSPATVRDKEMETFRAMVDGVGHRVNVGETNFAPGDRVRVLDGPLKGRECELASIDGEKYLVVRLSILGSATVRIETESVEKIN